MLQQIVEPGEEVDERGLWIRITLLPGFGILLAIGCVLIGQVNGKCDKKPSPACVIIDGLQGANVLIKKMSIPPIVLLVYRSTVYNHAADDDNFIKILPSVRFSQLTRIHIHAHAQLLTSIKHVRVQGWPALGMYACASDDTCRRESFSQGALFILLTSQFIISSFMA